MDIPFRGSLGPNVIKKAVKMISKSPWWVVALRVLMVVVIVSAVGILVYSWFTGEEINTSRLVRYLITGSFLGYYLFQPYLTAQKSYQVLLQGNQNLQGVISATGISYHAASGRSTDFIWSEFYYLFKADDFVVLMTKDRLSSIMHRSLFDTDQDWKSFLQHVNTRVRAIQ